MPFRARRLKYMHLIGYESYGVRFAVASNRRRTLERAARVARTAMVGQLHEIDPALAHHTFAVIETTADLIFELDGEYLSSNGYRRGFYHYFGSRLKMLVAEYAKGVVFVHAGVIGWKGKVILFPADSHQGKSTLTAALISRGAVYFSDDYAVVDSDGLVRPFPRRLSIRAPDGSGEWTDIPAKNFGGKVADKPLPIGAAIITKYKRNGKWKPKTLTPGTGMLEMVPFVIPLNANPAISLSLLKKALTPAIIAKSLRPDTSQCADAILDYIDKHVY